MERKLQRDLQNKVLGGVCSGVANYFGIDAAIVRVLFAIALFVFGTGFWLYILLWILMPAAPIGQAHQFADEQAVVEVKKTKSSWVAGLSLIIIGACLLLGNLFPQLSWRTFWPVALIVLGLLLIVPFKQKQS